MIFPGEDKNDRKEDIRVYQRKNGGIEMREKDIQVEFKKFNKIEGVFELKILKVSESGKYPPLPFSAVADHQVQALKSASDGSGLYHKISDSFIGDKNGQRRFPSAKPFDCFFLRYVPAFVVVCYYILIKDFLRLKDESDRKSITYDTLTHEAFYTVENGEYVEPF